MLFFESVREYKQSDAFFDIIIYNRSNSLGGLDLEGRIIKLTGGLYTVMDQQNQIRECKPLGIFRHRNIAPKVGDFVVLEGPSIIEVKERHNDFTRPMIANVDKVLLIQSAKEPDFSFHLLDRFLLLIESEGVEPIIIITKMDLLTQEESHALKEQLQYYQSYYPVLYTSSSKLQGIREIIPYIQDKIAVVAGQTGAGKSSLLNAINPDLRLDTNTISKALGRGKHTTRTVELIPFEAGWIADTPGFSKLDFTFSDPTVLKQYYPDFVALQAECRFLGCSHTHEPSCRVKQAVRQGEILPSRYQNYLLFYEEIKAVKPKYPR